MAGDLGKLVVQGGDARIEFGALGSDILDELADPFAKTFERIGWLR